MASVYRLLLVVALLTAGEALTSTEKVHFTGVTFTTSGTNYNIAATGLPDHDTADFPTNYNPNSIQAQSYSFLIPQNPSKASASKCLPGGPIGLATNGVAFYSPYTREGKNAVEGEDAETFDLCDGHPAERGSYHYHKVPDCVLNSDVDDDVVGVALDGYPIYGPKSGGKTLTSSDLDECHGRTVDGSYRYHLTADFPYIMGCFYGNVVDTSINFNGNECMKAISDDSGSSVVTAGASMLLLALAVGLKCVLFH